MSIIERIELFHVAIPLPAKFYPAWIPGFPQTENRFTLIKVITKDGVEGFSAGPSLGKERQGLGELLGPYLIGEDAEDIALIQQRLREISYLGWRNYWIEPAFWDIKGKLAKKPVYELLGGKSCNIRVYASSGEVKKSNERIKEAEERYNEGFRTLKLRVHEDESLDIKQIVETSNALQNKMNLAVDANQGWRVTIIKKSPLWDLERAKRFADICDKVGILWIEEPLPMDDYENLTKLTSYSKVPIAGGELHSSGLPELKMMIEKKCYNILQPDALFTGGIAQTMEVIKLCHKNSLIYTPHTWTNGIGLAVNLQLMIASGFADKSEFEYPINPPGWTIEARDGILEEPFYHKNGIIKAPTKPGLGFSVNKKALSKYGKRYFVMDKKRLIFYSILNRGISVSMEIAKAKGE